jgi:hypothetical protein
MEQDRDHSAHQVMVASHILYVNFFLKHLYIFGLEHSYMSNEYPDFGKVYEISDTICNGTG